MDGAGCRAASLPAVTPCVCPEAGTRPARREACVRDARCRRRGTRPAGVRTRGPPKNAAGRARALAVWCAQSIAFLGDRTTPVSAAAGTHRPIETNPATRTRAAVAAGVALIVTLGVAAALVQVARPGYFGMNVATGQVLAIADAIRRGDPPPGERLGNLAARERSQPTEPAADADAPVFRTTVYFPLYPAGVLLLREAGLTWRGALRAGALAGGLLLLFAAGLAAWRLGAGRTGVLLAMGLIAAQYPVKAAALSGRADLLAAGLTTAAFAAWLRDEDLREWWAPLCAALAVLVKATAISMPLAVLLWAIATRRPGDLGRFAARTAGIALAGVLLTIPFDGPARYLDAARTILSVPFNTSHPLRGPAELLRYLASYAEWLVAFSIAVYAACLPGWRQRPAVWWIAVTLGLSLVVLGNRGADHNHLLELMAAASILAGAWAAPRSGLVSGLAAVCIITVIFAASWRDLHEMHRRARSPVERRAEITAVIGATRGEVFTEDPMVAIVARRPAPISDPGALRAMARRGDPNALAIVRALERGRYDLVVLNADLDRERRRWYRDFHLGEEAIEAIRARYELDGQVDGYYLYRRRPGP